jgi:hypothetical protein
MAATIIRTTYALDAETVARLDRTANGAAPAFKSGPWPSAMGRPLLH